MELWLDSPVTEESVSGYGPMQGADALLLPGGYDSWHELLQCRIRAREDIEMVIIEYHWNIELLA